MITILITGPIGSGKSEVSRYLALKGYPVYDCDSRCKALYDKIPGIKERIERELDIPFPSISTVFADDSKLRKLENIIYPELVRDFECWRGGRIEDAVFIESAVAAQKPLFADIFDKVLLVTAPYETRLARNPKVAQRDVLQRFVPGKADWTIENDSTIEELHTKTDNFLKALQYEQKNRFD